jgi:hypothetical protein
LPLADGFTVATTGFIFAITDFATTSGLNPLTIFGPEDGLLETLALRAFFLDEGNL